MKAMEQSDQPQYLQTNQDNKDEQLDLFVLKHAAKAWTKKTKQPTGPRLNLKLGLSARNAVAATCYFLRVIDLEKTSSATNSFRMRKRHVVISISRKSRGDRSLRPSFGMREMSPH